MTRLPAVRGRQKLGLVELNLGCGLAAGCAAGGGPVARSTWHVRMAHAAEVPLAAAGCLLGLPRPWSVDQLQVPGTSVLVTVRHSCLRHAE